MRVVSNSSSCLQDTHQKECNCLDSSNLLRKVVSGVHYGGRLTRCHIGTYAAGAVEHGCSAGTMHSTNSGEPMHPALRMHTHILTRPN